MADALRLEGDRRGFVIFAVGDRLYGLPAGQVDEVVRTPALARVPQAPRALLGLGNLRGQVTPVASLRAMLGLELDAQETNGLALVLNGTAAMALAVGAAPTLVETSDVQTDGFVPRAGERLTGVFALDDGHVVHILDVEAMLATAFTPQPRRAVSRRTGGRDDMALRNDEDGGDRIIVFSVAGQEFALPLDAVREVIAAPDRVARSPHAEDLVMGVATYRDTVLPLLSLRGLLGLPENADVSGGKVVVTTVGGGVVGLVADSADAILGVDARRLDTPPAVLAARTGGETTIQAIYRDEGGRRLISVLDPGALFREDVMQGLVRQGSGAGADQRADAPLAVEDRFLAFRLGDEEFALPIEAVTEVARLPEVVTRVPNAPSFLEGVVSHRGEVLPVIDQRKRFDMPMTDAVSRRLIVVRTARHSAGLIVDAVSEVLTSPRDEIAPAPALAGEVNRLVLGVLNMEDAGRLVMVLDPGELLTRAERGLLDAFAADLSQ